MRQNQLYQLIAAKLSPDTQTKIAAKQCLRCDEPAEQGCRGLCELHWNQFRYARTVAKEIGEDALAEFEASEIVAGQVKPARRGRTSKGNTCLARVQAG